MENKNMSAEKLKEMFLKNMKPEHKIVLEIRKKYSLDDELALLRQRDSKPEEFQEYFNYVEECKAKVKQNN